MQKKKKFRIPHKKINASADIQKRLNKLHAQIRVELAGRTLPDPAEIIRQGRKERDKQLLENTEMIVKDLPALLSQMPANADVVIKGYEGGVEDVVSIKLVNINKDIHPEWYYGRHEMDEDGNTQAVVIQREERQAD